MASFRSFHGQLTLPSPVLDDLEGQISELLLGEGRLFDGAVGQQLLLIFGAEDWGPLPLPSLWNWR